MLDKEFNIVITGTLLILVFGIFSHAVIEKEAARPVESASLGSWACTTDVQVCPDGSTVNRTPPYCKFATCQN